MILIFAFVYLDWTQPFAFQKENSAESLMAELGVRDVGPEYQPLVDAAACDFDQKFPEGEASSSTMGPESLLRCAFDTPCNQQVERVVFHNRFIGAFVAGDPFWETIGNACPEMLSDDALKQFDNLMEGG